MRVRDVSFTVTALATLCGLLVVVILAELSSTGGDLTPSLNPSTSEAGFEVAGEILQPPPVQPVSYYGEIVERTLFNPERRLPDAETGEAGVAAEAAAAVRPERLKQQWMLTGVVISPDYAYAFLQHTSDGRTAKLQLGGKLDGWEAEEIAPDHIRLSAGDQTTSLPLHEPKDAQESSNTRALYRR